MAHILEVIKERIRNMNDPFHYPDPPQVDVAGPLIYQFLEKDSEDISDENGWRVQADICSRNEEYRHHYKEMFTGFFPELHNMELYIIARYVDFAITARFQEDFFEKLARFICGEFPESEIPREVLVRGYLLALIVEEYPNMMDLQSVRDSSPVLIRKHPWFFTAVIHAPCDPFGLVDTLHGFVSNEIIRKGEREASIELLWLIPFLMKYFKEEKFREHLNFWKDFFRERANWQRVESGYEFFKQYRYSNDDLMALRKQDSLNSNFHLLEFRPPA